MEQTITREAALELLKKYNEDKFHIQHAYTVEGVMRWYAQELGYGADVDFWGMVGLLHDIDFEQWPEQHCQVAPRLLAEGGVAPKMAPSEEYTAKASENKLMYEYVNAVNADTIIVPSVGDCMPSSISNTEFGNLLPLLVSGQYTAEQFCQQLSNLAEETRLD